MSPNENVRASDVDAYCRWINTAMDKSRVIFDGLVLRSTAQTKFSMKCDEYKHDEFDQIISPVAKEFFFLL